MYLWERETPASLADLDALLPLADADAQLRAGCHELARRINARWGE